MIPYDSTWGYILLFVACQWVILWLYLVLHPTLCQLELTADGESAEVKESLKILPQTLNFTVCKGYLTLPKGFQHIGTEIMGKIWENEDFTINDLPLNDNEYIY